MRNYVWVCMVKWKADDKPKWHFVRAFQTIKEARQWLDEVRDGEARLARKFVRE